jgi:hypothetical protein
VLAFLAIAIGLLLWYRRHNRLRALPAEKRDIPAAAEDVLNRPDPIEKAPSEPTPVHIYPGTYASSDSISQNPSALTGNHTQATRHSTPVNPFDDKHSIQTAITEGTNVIPIALVASDSHRGSTSRTDTETLPSTMPSSTSALPVRPSRSPDLNLNLEHVNISQDTLRPPYAGSLRSGISTRNSFMSGASYSSDFLNEAPMIITPTRSTVRQVLGVVKAEVINTPPTPNTSDGLRPPSLASRRAVTSPLAATSFGPADLVREVDESGNSGNPFSDAHSRTADGPSPTPSLATLGHPSLSHADSEPDKQNVPPPKDHSSRPSSMSTVKGVGNESLGLNQMLSPSSAVAGTLEEQQQRALAHAQAQAQAQILDDGKRGSSASITSSVSRTDSILESFPFVPPSPISDRPARSPPPPISPLVQQAFGGRSSPLAQVFAKPHNVVESKVTTDNAQASAIDDLPAPPSRRNLGLSTGSQFSTVSSGLGSFPFQIDPSPTLEGPPSRYSDRQRASLDTLALTSDLASHPLRFDRDSDGPKAV